MECPRCHIPLAARTGSPYRGDFNADTQLSPCTQCSGQWVAVSRLPKGWHRDHEVMTVDESLRISCASCLAPMDKMRSSANLLILYDRCEPCGGLWFDAGELERLLRALRLASTAK